MLYLFLTLTTLADLPNFFIVNFEPVFVSWAHDKIHVTI